MMYWLSVGAICVSMWCVGELNYACELYVVTYYYAIMIWCDSHPSVGMMLYTASCRLSVLEAWRQVEELDLQFALVVWCLLWYVTRESGKRLCCLCVYFCIYLVRIFDVVKQLIFGKRFNCWFSALFNDWSSTLFKKSSLLESDFIMCYVSL